MYNNLFYIYDLESFNEFVSSWSRLPFEEFAANYDELINSFELETKRYFIANKVENTCKKILMAWYGGQKAIESESEFIGDHNRYCPVMFGSYEIEFLYNIESMIILGRSALDLAASVFNEFLLNKEKMDSFNDFRKEIMNSSDDQFNSLKNMLSFAYEDKTSWLNVLCGNERGRSVRDQIAHQMTIQVEYLETRPTSDKEYCHLIIHKKEIPFEKFIEDLCRGIIDICICGENIILKKFKNMNKQD